MNTEAAAKKDTQKLQRAIVDGLEDVKAQDIRIFDTEHLSALFERVIVASGTSNRQTRALAASVRDAVRDAGFSKPRMEGEDNGEWIIVDCGAAVAHIMQPAIRQYYHLEEIWGEKPVRLKLGAPRPVVAPQPQATGEKAKTAKGANSLNGSPSLRRASAAKTAFRQAEQAAKAEKERARPAVRKAGSGRAAGAQAATKRPAAGKVGIKRSLAASAAPKRPATGQAPANRPAAGKRTASRTASTSAKAAKKVPAKKTARTRRA